jgi:hypothetical protein
MERRDRASLQSHPPGTLQKQAYRTGLKQHHIAATVPRVLWNSF